MPRCASRGYLTRFLRPTSRSFYIIAAVSFTISFLWIQNNREEQYPLLEDEDLTQEALQNVAQDYRYAEVYRKKSKLPKGLKYILLWTPQDYAPFYYLGSGQRGFIKKNCSVINCYVTADKDFFDGDLSRFDAIAFNGRNILNTKRSQLPKHRWPHQKYIFFNMESSDNYPVCNEVFDGFFNWTSTYKLDSDIPYPYILIRNTEGDVVGPKRNMEWGTMNDLDEDLSYVVQNKSKGAAWFVSHCASRSGRKEYVTTLQKALDKYKLNIDIYGSCGPLKCPKNQQSDCGNKLEKEYYFYMSMENSFAEDYVTEKLLTALQYYVVPIVYGGANYSRFLPPSSYLDARAHSPEELAALMHQLTLSPDLYRQYFRWKSHYTYHNPSSSENMCAVCEALNNRTRVETFTVYENFRSWWNSNFTQLCKKWSGR